MNLIWKGAAALGLTAASLGMAAAPAQAQYHRDGWRGQDYRGDYRRWDRSRHWRGDRGYHRTNWRSHRPRCWTEWRYDHYRDRRVRVRICR